MGRRAWRKLAAAAGSAAVLCAATACSGVQVTNADQSHTASSRPGGSATTAPTATTSAAPDATLADLAGIVIPPYCQMPAVTLTAGAAPRATSGATSAPTGEPGGTPTSADSSHAGSSDTTPPSTRRTAAGAEGHGQIVRDGAAAPVLVDVTGDGAKEVVAAYVCDAGGTTWPALLLAVKHGGEVVGQVRLGDIARTEHAYVTSWEPGSDGLIVDWVAFEGDGRDKRPYQNLFSVPGAAATFPATERGRALGQTTIVDGGSEVSFVTPTGKVACTLGGSSATCAVTQPTWTGEAQCAGAVDGVRLRNGQTAYACTGGAPFREAAGPAPAWQRQGSDPAIRGAAGEMAGLAFGRTLTTGKATCTVATSGVTCADPLTGHGFTVAPESVRTF